MSGFLKKYGPTIGVVLIIGILAFIVKMQWDASNEREADRQRVIQMKTLADEIVRNQSKYVEKDDLEKFAKEMGLNLSAIQKDLDENNAELEGMGKFLAQSLGRNQTHVPSSGTRPRPVDPNNPDKPQVPVCPDGTPCPDPYGYLTNEQLLALSEPFPGVDVPIGSVGFSAWEENPWSISILPRKYQVSTVLGVDEDGRHYVYNQMQIEADGKKHKIPIEQAEYQQVYPESEFHFNPKVHLGVDVGAVVTDTRAEVIPNLQVSLFSYGRTKVNKDTEWSFLGVGVGYGTQSQTFNALVTPVNYNLGQHIPLIESLHVGPTISVDHTGEFFVGGGLRVGL